MDDYGTRAEMAQELQLISVDLRAGRVIVECLIDRDIYYA